MAAKAYTLTQDSMTIITKDGREMTIEATTASVVGLPLAGGQVRALQQNVVPGVPTNLRRSSYFTDTMLKVRWQPPEDNPDAVDRYVVRYRRKKSNDYILLTTTTRLSAKAKGLKPDTKYVFSVRAINSGGYYSGTAEIEAETRWRKATKALLSPLVFTGATLASPFAGIVGGAVLGGAAGGMVGGKTGGMIYDKSDTTAGKGAGIGVGVATGVGAGAVGAAVGGVGGAVVGTVGAPVVGGVAAHRFIHGSNDYSDQSDDDDD